MKEHIYTIPVIDGFNAGGECPFCNMYHKLDTDAVEYMLGASYMEDDIRMETDKKGFCREHYKKMFAMQNRLGLSLMLHTHLKKINSELEATYKNMAYTGKRSFFFQNSEPQENKVASLVNGFTQNCYICDRSENSFKQYLETFFYLWKNDSEIIDMVKNGNGFCLEHFSVLISTAEKKLNATEFKNFCEIIIPKQMEILKALEGDLDWFIQKFDYRFSDEPWKNSKDALPRGIQKIASINDLV